VSLFSRMCISVSEAGNRSAMAPEHSAERVSSHHADSAFSVSRGHVTALQIQITYPWRRVENPEIKENRPRGLPPGSSMQSANVEGKSHLGPFLAPERDGVTTRAAEFPIGTFSQGSRTSPFGSHARDPRKDEGLLKIALHGGNRLRSAPSPRFSPVRHAVAGGSALSA